MNDTKYIGMDVHRESISIAVLNSVGKIVLECVVETKASILLHFIDGLRGELHVTFEEGTWVAWFCDLLKPHVTKLAVCDPPKNASMKQGNKSDKIDARRLAELPRLNQRCGFSCLPLYRIYRGLAPNQLTGRQTVTVHLRILSLAYRQLSIGRSSNGLRRNRGFDSLHSLLLVDGSLPKAL